MDVRQDDVYGGHIVGSRHYPFHEVADSLESIVADAKGKDRVVFHCSLSQQRGPEACRLFSRALERSSQAQIKPELYILDGGMFTLTSVL